MTTFTTLSGVSFNVTFARTQPISFNRYLIYVDVLFPSGKEFTVISSTDNMPGLEIAHELEGQARFEALYLLVANKMDFFIGEASHI